MIVKLANNDLPAQFDPPPRYENLAESSPPAESSGSPPVPNVKPTNQLYICRKHESIKGAFMVDPALRIPVSLLHPLTKEERKLGKERENVKLYSHHKSVDVEIFLVRSTAGGSGSVDEVDLANKSGGVDEADGASADGSSMKKTKLDVRSHHSSVTLRLHAPSGDRAPFQLEASSHHSSVTVYLPRSFRGPLLLKTKHRSSSFSPALSPFVTTVNEVDNVQRCFVGDFEGWTGEGKDWHGDEANLSSHHGSIKVRFADEDELEKAEKRALAEKKVSTKNSTPGRFGRIFGL